MKKGLKTKNHGRKEKEGKGNHFDRAAIIINIESNHTSHTDMRNICEYGLDKIVLKIEVKTLICTSTYWQKEDGPAS